LNQLPYKVLITDDNFSDKTLEIIEKFIIKYPKKFTLIEHKKNRGIGFVLREKINYAIKNKFDIIVVLAGNGKDDPLEVNKLFSYYPVGKTIGNSSRLKIYNFIDFLIN